MLSNNIIKEVLLEVNNPARAFFSNILESSTGIDPRMANCLNLEQSIHFLKYTWGQALYWSNQRVDYIDKSVRALERFLRANFQSEKELHNLHIFSQKLEKLKTDRLESSEESEEVVRTTELLQKLPSVGFKTAALIMRLLCLDCNFFTVKKSVLNPPLDRVNYRICTQIFGESYTTNRLGKIKLSFSKEQTKSFGQLGREILGDDRVLIDNLWFIGHFYHDGTDCS